MARDEAPPFARGETYYNGGLIDQADPLGLGGVNLEGKEFVFEPNSQDQGTGYPAASDPNGRPIMVKVVRNRSGVNMKPARLVHYDAGGTFTFNSATVGPFNYKTGVDGYCYQLADRPAGIVDEFLPAAGVPPWDLFYIVIDGPSQGTQPGTAVSATPGLRLVPAATTGRTNDDSGRLALQDVTGSAATLANNVQNCVGFANATNSTNNAVYNIDVRDLD